MEGIVNKVNNQASHLQESDLVGAVKDIFGQPVTIGGKTFDHLKEVEDALGGVGNQLNGISKKILDGTFSGDALEEAVRLRGTLQNQKDTIQNVLNKARSEASNF